MIMLILMLLCLCRTALYLCIVHCAMFCLEFIFLCMYAHFMYVHCTRIQRVHAAVHSYSCICLLHSVACSLGVIVYIFVVHVYIYPGTVIVRVSC